MHPKLSNFILYAKKQGILETIINTNATNLTQELSEKLIDSGLDFMIYSFVRPFLAHGAPLCQKRRRRHRSATARGLNFSVKAEGGG